jgi:IS5 family transposase
MENVVPWQALIDLIEPHYPKTSSNGARPPYPLETMLRIHLLQQWYDLSDPAMEDELIEVPTMRRFAAIDMISDRIPDETTTLAFRHLLEKHDLCKQIYCFAEDLVYEIVKAHLKANGMAMKQGTIIDASLIAAPCSTSTRAKPECAGFERTRVRCLPGKHRARPDTPERRVDDLIETAIARRASDCSGALPRQGTYVSGDQRAVCLLEAPAAGHAQAQLQSECAGRPLEPILGMAQVAMYFVIGGLCAHCCKNLPK